MNNFNKNNFNKNKFNKIFGYLFLTICALTPLCLQCKNSHLEKEIEKVKRQIKDIDETLNTPIRGGVAQKAAFDKTSLKTQREKLISELQKLEAKNK